MDEVDEILVKVAGQTLTSNAVFQKLLKKSSQEITE